MKSSSIFVGIDPGLHGAVSVIDPKMNVILVKDTPIVKVKKGKKNKSQYIESQMVTLLEAAKNFGRVELVTIEMQWNRPGMSSTAMFNIATGYGLWIGITAALRLPYTTVAPMSWKKKFGIPSGSEKAASIQFASRLFPRAPLTRKKDDGRADSLLIGLYGMKQGEKK